MSLIYNDHPDDSKFWSIVGKWSKMYERNSLMDFFISNRAYFSKISKSAHKLLIIGESIKQAYRRNKIKYVGGEEFAEEFNKLLAGLCKTPY